MKDKVIEIKIWSIDVISVIQFVFNDFDEWIIEKKRIIIKQKNQRRN